MNHEIKQHPRSLHYLQSACTGRTIQLDWTNEWGAEAVKKKPELLTPGDPNPPILPQPSHCISNPQMLCRSLCYVDINLPGTNLLQLITISRETLNIAKVGNVSRKNEKIKNGFWRNSGPKCDIINNQDNNELVRMIIFKEALFLLLT